MKPFYRICWIILRVFMKIYCRLRIYGIENIPKSGGVIIASNHIAAADPPFVGTAVNRELYFLAKKELFRNVLLRTLITSLNAIPVDRGVFDRNALDRAESILSGGYGLILFPEGTRSRTGKLGKGKPGIGMLARKAMVPIVPAYIENSRGFAKIPFSSKRLTISFGPPISPVILAGFPDNKEGYRAIVENVMDGVKRLQGDAEEIAVE